MAYIQNIYIVQLSHEKSCINLGWTFMSAYLFWPWPFCDLNLDLFPCFCTINSIEIWSVIYFYVNLHVHTLIVFIYPWPSCDLYLDLLTYFLVFVARALKFELDFNFYLCWPWPSDLLSGLKIIFCMKFDTCLILVMPLKEYFSTPEWPWTWDQIVKESHFFWKIYNLS